MLGTTIAPITTTAPPQTVAPNKFQNALQNVSSVINNVVKPAADVYSQVRPAGSGSSSTSPTLPGYSSNVTAPAAPEANKSNTMKYVLIGGSVLLGAGAIYFMTRKKKGKK